MFVVFYGNDVIGVRRAAHEYISDKGTATTIEADNFEPGMIAESAGGLSLFSDSTTYIIDTPSADLKFKEEVESHLAALAESTHQFVLIEGALLAADKKVYGKYAERMEEFKRASDRQFNVFALADALARKDKKSLWLLLHDAFRAGFSSEEIIGTLWWQLKTLRLAAITSTASEAGMKDFPYNKAKRALSKFKAEEVAEKSRELLAAYHDARLGKLELDLALERWVLTL